MKAPVACLLPGPAMDARLAVIAEPARCGNMQATQNEAISKGGVWLSVNSDDDAGWLYTKPGKFQEWVHEQKAAPAALLLDPSGAADKAFGARTTPHVFLIGPTGTVLYAGGIDSIASTDDIPKATNHVRQAVGEAMAGKPVSVSSTRSYGCAIKYR